MAINTYNSTKIALPIMKEKFSQYTMIAGGAVLLEPYRGSTAAGAKPIQCNTANSAKQSTTVDSKTDGMMTSQEVCLHRMHFAYS